MARDFDPILTEALFAFIPDSYRSFPFVSMNYAMSGMETRDEREFSRRRFTIKDAANNDISASTIVSVIR